VAALLALLSAVWFALSAALQQRGQFTLARSGTPVLWLHTKSSRALRAAVLGVSAGLFFGLSASFAKPVIDDLHVSIGEAAGAWQTWALLGFGFIAFVIQQLSLATGRLAPAMAAVSVANPAVSVILGILLPGVEGSAAEMPHADPSPA
jgi:hypothetical protein